LPSASICARATLTCDLPTLREVASAARDDARRQQADKARQQGDDARQQADEDHDDEQFRAA